MSRAMAAARRQGGGSIRTTRSNRIWRRSSTRNALAQKMIQTNSTTAISSAQATASPAA